MFRASGVALILLSMMLACQDKPAPTPSSPAAESKPTPEPGAPHTLELRSDDGSTTVKLDFPIPEGWTQSPAPWGTSFHQGEVHMKAEVWCIDCGVEKIHSELKALSATLAQHYDVEIVKTQPLGMHGLLVLRRVRGRKDDAPLEARRNQLEPGTFSVQCHYFDPSGRAIGSLLTQGPLALETQFEPSIAELCHGTSWR